MAVAGASAYPGLWIDNSATLVGPSNPGAVLKGPADGANVIGPDGSVIGASGRAGIVVAPPLPGGVVQAAGTPGVVALTGPVGWGLSPLGLELRSGWVAPAGVVGIGLRGW